MASIITIISEEHYITMSTWSSGRALLYQAHIVIAATTVHITFDP